ncbi:MAG: hypothetical protein ACOCSL_03160 [Thermoplasmatota archaeon]
MAYGTKYIIEFTDIEKVIYRVELQKDGYSSSATKLPGSGTPLVFEMPDYEIYDPIKSFGGTLEVIAQSDRQLDDLYTVDYKGWKVVIYRNYGESDEQIIYTGYAEAEQYEQSLVQQSNYKVTIVFNNPISILKREMFVDENGDHYKGITTAYDVLVKALEKTGISYDHIYWLSDLQINDFNHSDRIQLQGLVVTQESYIDEDDEPMTCHEIIRTLLEPWSLTAISVGNDVFIVDYEYIADGSVDVKYADDFGNSFSSYENSVDTNLLISDLIERDTATKYHIQSAVNFYLIHKNKYIHPIFEMDDLGDLGDPTHVWELSSQTITAYPSDESYNGDREYLPIDEPAFNQTLFWMCAYDDSQLEKIELATWEIENIPYYIGKDYYETEDGVRSKTAFVGGIKPVAFEDDQKINYDEDDKDFERYVFIQNCHIPFSPDDWSPDFPNYDSEHDYGSLYEQGTITPYREPEEDWDLYHDDTGYPYRAPSYKKTEKALEYIYQPPFLSTSKKVLLDFNFDIRIVSTQGGIGYVSGMGYTTDLPMCVQMNQVPSAYSYFIIYTNIYRYDLDGNITHYLRLRNDNIDDPDDRHPDLKRGEPLYEWFSYDGSESEEQLICKLCVFKTNLAGSGINIMNQNHRQHVYIPINIGDTMEQVKVVFRNLIYEVYNYAEGDYNDQQYDIIGRTWEEDYIEEDHLKAKPFYKQHLPMYGVKNIKLDVVYASTLEKVDYQDEELQYYIDNKYKTESISSELLHSTRDDIYINDISGLMMATSLSLDTIKYINTCQANGDNVSTLEDLKGQKFIRHYEKNRIILGLTAFKLIDDNSDYPFNLPFFKSFTKPDDPKWGDKVFLLKSINSWDVRNNSADITLEEV